MVGHLVWDNVGQCTYEEHHAVIQVIVRLVRRADHHYVPEQTFLSRV